MLKKVVDVTLAYRWFVVLGLCVLLAVGGYSLYTLPVEAFPDLTNNQVTVVTEAPSMPPTEVEQLVTYPIEQAMMGMPKQLEVRSLSELGLSMITIVFDDSVPMYFARQLVNERLQQISGQLPSGIQPVLGLPATAFGELYQYTLSGPMSPMALKDLQEWQIKRQLRMVPGVSEVNTWGGEVKQYQITVDPAVLAQYGLTLNDVAQRVEGNNTNFGGGFIEHNDEQYTLRGSGRAESTADLGNIVLLSHGGVPVLLRDVAQVAIGAAPRHGAVLRNGETVSGMVIMLKGENGKRVIQAIKQRIAEMHLPPGVKISPFYDQSSVIDGTIQTVKKNLFEGFLLVTVVLFFFLGNARAALITASVIPLAMLVSFINMRIFGVSANLMSLGAIDFGMIVDGAVVMMENAIHRLEEGPPGESSVETIRSAASEVARPMLFGIVIIIAVYECVGDRLAIGPKPTWVDAGISYDCFVNKRFRFCSLDQQFLLPPSLQDWLPEDHLARFVADVMNELDLSPMYAKYERSDGRGLSAYHPLLLARLLLYGYCVGINSSRKIEKATYDNVAFRYLAADQHPDHDTLASFRQEHLDALAGLFVQALKLCQKAGLVKLGNVAIDGTKIMANASTRRSVNHQKISEREQHWRSEVERLLKQAQQTDQEEDQRFGVGKLADP